MKFVILEKRLMSKLSPTSTPKLTALGFFIHSLGENASRTMQLPYTKETRQDLKV